MDSYWVIPDDPSDIYHYGVKGMKWGVRKSEYRSMSRDQKRLAKAKRKSDRRDRRAARDLSRREFLANNQDFDTRKKTFVKDGKKFAKGFLLTNLAAIGAAHFAPDFAELTAYIGIGYNIYNLMRMAANQLVYNLDLDEAIEKQKGGAK